MKSNAEKLPGNLGGKLYQLKKQFADRGQTSGKRQASELYFIFCASLSLADKVVGICYLL